MAKVIWTRGATVELRAIRAYVDQFNPLAAQRLASRLMSAVQTLENFPDRGRVIGEARRELVVIPPYLIRYRREDHTVFILELRHGAREPD